MDDLAYYLAGVVTLVAAVAKFLQSRGQPRRPGLLYLCGLLLALGLAAILLAPATLRLGAALEPIPNLTRLIGNELAAGAVFCLLGLLAHAAYGDDTARRRMRVQAWVLAGAATAMAALFLSTRTTFTVDFVNAYATQPAIAAYEIVFLLYATWGLVADIVLVTRVATHAQKAFLRTGLWLGLLGAWFGLAWSLWKISVSLLKVTTGDPVPLESEISSLLSAIAILFVALGATMTAWGPRAAHPVVWWNARRRHRRLAPMWAAVHVAVPDVAFEPPGASMEFRLYRRIVEIRDSGLALARYVHPDVPAWVGAAAADAGITVEDELAALVEAADLASALEAHAVGHHFGGSALNRPHALAADIDAEAKWLVRVSVAFARSPIVESVRQRVREELRTRESRSA
jgi:hypothetical protein